MKLNSIRWKLSLTYAGIALVAAVAMGAVLLLTLRSYYSSQERAYLTRNAISVGRAVAPLLGETPPQELVPHIKLLAFLGQMRVRLTDASGALIADSGAPGMDSPIVVSSVTSEKIGPRFLSEGPQDGGQSASTDANARPMPALPTLPDTVFIQKAPENEFVFKLGLAESQPVKDQFLPVTPGARTEKLQFFYRQGDRIIGATSIAAGGEDGRDRTLVAVIPASGTMYGFDLQAGTGRDEARSSEVVQQKIFDQNGGMLGTLTLSDGPAIGSEIVAGVARGGVVAALAAVIIAAAVGWWVSRKMSAPLTELTASTVRMSTGDLSARARAETADEFGDLARAFNDMADRVENIVASLRRFASDAAHELQTPLTALNTNLELAAREQPGNAYLEQARAQFQRLETLAANLLDLSRIESGDAPAFAPVDLAALLKETGERYASEAEQARKLFYLEVPEGEVRVDGDAEQLKRVLTNLLDNALKFTPPGGMVEAGVTVEDGAVSMWVEDNGSGVPEEDRPHLFERFHRGTNAAGLPGSGLGLAIVQAIAERHGGRVRFEAQKQGSKFSVELPAGPSGT